MTPATDPLPWWLAVPLIALMAPVCFMILSALVKVLSGPDTRSEAERRAARDNIKNP